jgi:hypothetical protein
MRVALGSVSVHFLTIGKIMRTRMPLAGALLLSAGLCAAAEPDYAVSYRLIARELGLNKNTILEIVKRNRAKSA